MVNQRVRGTPNGVTPFPYLEPDHRFTAEQTVTVRRDFSEEEWRAVLAWITETPGLTGNFWASPNHWDKGARSGMFLFSDENTAIAFKLKWC